MYGKHDNGTKELFKVYAEVDLALCILGMLASVFIAKDSLEDSPFSFPVNTDFVANATKKKPSCKRSVLSAGRKFLTTSTRVTLAIRTSIVVIIVLFILIYTYNKSNS